MNDFTRNGQENFGVFRQDYEQFKKRWSVFSFDKVFKYEAFGPEDILKQESFKQYSGQEIRDFKTYLFEYFYFYLLSLFLIMGGWYIGRKKL